MCCGVACENSAAESTHSVSLQKRTFDTPASDFGINPVTLALPSRFHHGYPLVEEDLCISNFFACVVLLMAAIDRRRVDRRRRYYYLLQCSCG